VGKPLWQLGLVGAILVGLLAMHTIEVSHGGAHPEAHASALAATSPLGFVASVAVNDDRDPHCLDCPGVCDPVHAVSSMACTLALLVTAHLVAVSPPRQWSGDSAAARNFLLKLSAFAVLVNPATPDLIRLSINRT
jgi:hypothetical protein